MVDRKLTLLLMIIIWPFVLGYGQNFKTTIKGEIVGKKVDTLLIQKVTGDLRSGNTIKIPVTNGSFSHKLETKAREAYDIVYSYQHKQGSWRPIEFMVEPGEIEFKLYTEEPDKNKIKGSELNDEFLRLRQKTDSISKEGREIMKRVKSDAPDSLNKEQLDTYIKSHPAMDSLKKEYYSIYTDYIKAHTNPLSYYLVWDINRKEERHDIPLSFIKENYKRHVQKYPDHPYTSVIKADLRAEQKITSGERFIDFKAPDLEGNQIKLSELVDNRIAILNFWGSWCGPCIRKSRKIVPLYKQYHGKDFTIVGIAREFDNTKRLKKTLNREDFPWKNLVELDDRNDIWRKYGMPNGAGSMIMIDRNGKILAIDLSVKKMKQILDNKL